MVATPFPGIQLMNLAGKSIWWELLGQGICVQERTIDTLGRGTDDAVKTDGLGRHVLTPEEEGSPPILYDA